jgi:hypothetical protein
LSVMRRWTCTPLAANHAMARPRNASLLAFGAFQPWDLQRASATCVAAGHTGMEGEGPITLGFGIATVILGVLMLARIRLRLMAILALVLFVVVALIVLAAWWEANSKASSVVRPLVPALPSTSHSSPQDWASSAP